MQLRHHLGLAWPWLACLDQTVFFLIGFAKNVCMLFFSSNHYFLQVWCILHLLHYFFHLRYYCIICASWHIMHVFRSLFLYLCHSYNYPVHVIGIPNVYKRPWNTPSSFPSSPQIQNNISYYLLEVNASGTCIIVTTEHMIM